MAARPGFWARRRRGAALVLAWLPAVLVALPLVLVFWRAVQPAGEMWEQVVEHRLSGYLWHSAGLAAGVTFLALLLGVPSAWMVSVYDFPGRKVCEWALLLPLAVPGYVAALAYIDGLEKVVPFYLWVRKTYGVPAFRTVQAVGPWVFSILVLGATLYPYVFLSCRAAFARRAAGVVEAARVLGAGSRRVFWRIALPMARPALAAGGGLVALEALNDVGVVSAFGLPTLTPGIFRVWGEGHLGVAMRLALLLLLFSIVAGLAEKVLRGRRRFAEEQGSGAVAARRRLGPAGVLRAWLACGVPLALGFGVPAWRLVRWAWLSWGDIEWDVFRLAAWHSLSVALLAGLIIVAGAFLLEGSKRALGAASLNTARRVAVLGYATPAALIAVGVAWLVSQTAQHVPGLASLALSSSIFGLTLAQFIRYLAAAVQPLAAGFERVSASFHEAARSLGASPLRALWHIDFPLVRPALLAGATLAFLDVFKELTMTLVLRPLNYETLTSLIFRLADQTRVPEASIPALFLILCSLPGLLPLTHLLRQASR